MPAEHLGGPFSPATWGSNYEASHQPSWAPESSESALGQLQAHMGSASKWKTIREAFMAADQDGNGVIMHQRKARRFSHIFARGKVCCKALTMQFAGRSTR